MKILNRMIWVNYTYFVLWEIQVSSVAFKREVLHEKISSLKGAIPGIQKPLLLATPVSIK